MQATCPQCAQVIAVDDSKVPPGPFMLRCPRCQKTMKMSGNGVETPAAEEPVQRAGPPSPSPPMQEASQTPPPQVEKSAPAPTQEVSQAPPPQVEAAAQTPTQQAPTPPPAPSVQQQPPNGNAPSAPNNNGHRALIELPDSEHTTAMVQVLQKQGYAVDTMDLWDERAIELQQGVYDLVVTHRNGLPSTPKKELFHLVNGLSPEQRSRLFLVLVGDKYKTGNTSEAFAAMADLVCHPQDMQAADGLLRTTIAEKGRLYRAYLDILRKKEAGEL